MVASKNRHILIKYIVIILVLLITLLVTICLGAVSVPLKETFHILISKLPLINKFSNPDIISDINTRIILGIRLPRVLMSVLVGMGLSISGAVFQGIFKNPLADPYILGVSSGASLGAAIAIAIIPTAILSQFSLVAILAFIGAFTTMFLVYFIGKTHGQLVTNILILAGVSISFICSSLISLIMVVSRESATNIIFWTMGSMTGSSYTKVLIILPIVIVGSIITISFARDINILSSGDESASSLGVNPNFTKLFLLIITSLITALCVSYCGIIGFVGLIVPHAVRIISGPDHRHLIPLSGLVGGIFLLICDTLARTLFAPTEIPIGALTALFGAPFFIYLLINGKKKVFYDN